MLIIIDTFGTRNLYDQLENRVLCKTFSSRLNSEVQPSVTN